MGGGSLSMSLSRIFHRENEKSALTPYICQGTWADDRSIGAVHAMSALSWMAAEWQDFAPVRFGASNGLATYSAAKYGVLARWWLHGLLSFACPTRCQG